MSESQFEGSFSFMSDSRAACERHFWTQHWRQCRWLGWRRCWRSRAMLPRRWGWDRCHKIDTTPWWHGRQKKVSNRPETHLETQKTNTVRGIYPTHWGCRKNHINTRLYHLHKYVKYIITPRWSNNVYVDFGWIDFHKVYEQTFKTVPLQKSTNLKVSSGIQLKKRCLYTIN